MEQFTLSIFTENTVGLLQRITTVFTRRHINIESLTTSESELPGVHRFIIVVNCTEEMATILCAQLDKIIGVFKAFLLRSEDVVHQELALYKVSTERLANGTLERIIRDNHLRVLTVEPDYLMIEKAGHPTETLELFQKLEPYGIMGFTRSGTIAISKKPLNLDKYVAGKLV